MVKKMKPQNKLGGKLDKIKKRVSYESSKKVSEIARVKKEQLDEIAQNRLEHIEALELSIVNLLTKIEIMRQANENDKNSARQTAMNLGNELAKTRDRVKRLEEGLTYYKKGKHYTKGKFNDKVKDRGEKATEILDETI